MSTLSRARAFSRCPARVAGAALKTFVASCVLALLVVTAFGQAATSVSGTIKDPTGGVVGKAVVTLTDDKTSIKRSVLSDAAGIYLFNDVASGGYSVEASAEGFAVFGSKVTITGAPISLDIALELAQQTGQVSVE